MQKIGRKTNNRHTSEYVGVSFDKRSKKWNAKISFKGKSIHLKRYEIEKDAAKAYNTAAIELFGKDARINDI